MNFDLENRTKPFLKWAGGKSTLLMQLITQFPKNFKRYIEPFVGGGAVFLSLKSGEIESVINDYNKDIYNLYLVIRDSPKELMDAINSMTLKYSESFYYTLRESQPTTDIDQAARTLFLNKTGFNGLYRLNTKGKFNVPFGKRIHCPSIYHMNNVLDVSQRLKKVAIYNEDFESILEQSGLGDFVYCDPPYAPLSPTSSFNTYNSHGFSLQEQTRLRNACERAVKRGAYVALSNSTAPVILDLYSHWNVKRVYAKRLINSKGDKRGEIEEILVLMYNE